MSASLSLAECLRLIFKDKPNMNNVDWVLYEHGTFVAIDRVESRTNEQLIEATNEALDYFAEGVVPGGELGDFTVKRMDRVIPDHPVYIVSYPAVGKSLVGTVLITGEKNEAKVGLAARSTRTPDAQQKKVVCTNKTS